jgi:hypothetical protein
MPASTRAIEVTGLRELRTALRQASAELPRELARVNQQAAEIVAAEARRRAPEGPHEGKPAITPVRQSIRALRQQSKGVVAIGGARSPHAVVLEFGGTIPRRGQSKLLVVQQQRAHRGFERAGLAVTRVRAQPYVYPALDAKRDEVVEAYADLVGKLLHRAFPLAG